MPYSIYELPEINDLENDLQGHMSYICVKGHGHPIDVCIVFFSILMTKINISCRRSDIHARRSFLKNVVILNFCPVSYPRSRSK